MVWEDASEFPLFPEGRFCLFFWKYSFFLHFRRQNRRSGRILALPLKIIAFSSFFKENSMFSPNIATLCTHSSNVSRQNVTFFVIFQRVCDDFGGLCGFSFKNLDFSSLWQERKVVDFPFETLDFPSFLKKKSSFWEDRDLFYQNPRFSLEKSMFRENPATPLQTSKPVTRHHF